MQKLLRNSLQNAGQALKSLLSGRRDATERLNAAKSKLREINRSNYVNAKVDELCKMKPEQVYEIKNVKELRELANAAFEGIGTEKNEKVALAFWAGAALKGDVSSGYQLALCMLEGRGTPQDEARAIEVLEDIVNSSGFPWAAFTLATVYSKRNTQEELTKAFELFHKAAEGAVVPAYLNLYNCYALGIGTDVNERNAIEWLRRSAKANDPLAMYYLGVRLSRGIGVAKDPLRSFEFFLRAAEGGVEDAIHNVGVAYLRGEGCIQDATKARKWFMMAAMRGHVPSTVNICTMLEKGIGGEQNLSLALVLYENLEARKNVAHASQEAAFARQQQAHIRTLIEDPEAAKAAIENVGSDSIDLADPSRYTDGQGDSLSALTPDNLIFVQSPTSTPTSSSATSQTSDTSQASNTSQTSNTYQTSNQVSSDDMIEMDATERNMEEFDTMEVHIRASDQTIAQKLLQEAQRSDMTPEALHELLHEYTDTGDVEITTVRAARNTPHTKSNSKDE